MPVAPAYRDRDPVEFAVLQALADRADEGMTLFELRSHVDVDIDELEAALGSLKEDGLIDVEGRPSEGTGTTIRPADHVVVDEAGAPGESVFDRLRERLPF